MDKKLKMWVRYDGRGKIVTGSNRLNRTKPLNGTWKEVIAEVCCTTLTTTTTQSLVPENAIMNKQGTEYVRTLGGDYILTK